MLTQVVSGRVFHFSHAIGRNAAGGNGFTFPVGVALGREDVAYVVSRSNENQKTPHVTKITLSEELLGEFGKWGEGDGEFVWPTSVAVDREGKVYVADEWLQRISVFDEEGKFRGKWGRAGVGDGELSGPSGLAFDARDDLYVVDSLNHRVQKFTKDGQFLARWGGPGRGDGEFCMPWGITVDGEGRVYVADWKNHRVQKFAPDGKFLATFGRPGNGPGSLNHPTGVAVDTDGDVYVVDWGNERLQIYAPDGDFVTSLIGDAQQLSKWAQMTVDANPDVVKARRRVKSLEPEWRFRMPTAVAFDTAKRRIIVADTQRGRLQVYVKETEGEYMDPQLNL
jgi:DNA-binding beta-propeller fold protein YncE